MKPCILPWINFNTNPFGRSRPCGYSLEKSSQKLGSSSIAEQFNNPIFKDIRSSFLDGKWPKNCERCETMEKLGGTSKKTSENLAYYGENKQLLKKTSSDGSVDLFPSHIDIRLGTICNLKCIHCGTGNSKKWMEDKELIGKYENTENIRTNDDWVNQASSPIWEELKRNVTVIRKLNWLGGEPLAVPQLYKFLEWIPEENAKNIELQFVTNGLLLKDSTFKIFKKFKRILLNISIDVVGERAEYFRFPLEWTNFENKLKLTQGYLNEVDGLSAHFQWTASNVSTYYFSETLKYCQSQFPQFVFKYCNYVDKPYHMSPQNFPKHIKERITSLNFSQDKSNSFNFYVQYMNENDLWLDHGQTFLNYMNDLDKVRSLSWRSAFPELYQDLLTS